ncbi:6,7-dimethyl-8-ribityllumazine synthase [bacterium]|nr:6,7-dimethyl-8-ribityllumazine synthase [bacterium]
MIIEGQLRIDGQRFALVVSRFNDFLTSKLAEGATDCLLRHGAKEDKVDQIMVPGAFELPQAAKMVVDGGRYDAVICLGAIIRGGTPHFEFVAAEASKGIAQIALSSDIPVSFGVLTTDTLEQAIERSGSKGGNKGWEAAMTAIEMLDLAGKLKA